VIRLRSTFPLMEAGLSSSLVTVPAYVESCTLPFRLRYPRTCQLPSSRRLPSNKRLKLAGADRSKGIGVLCPWRDTDFVQLPCADERVARSLSAIR
jgi:hypothetical protein